MREESVYADDGVHDDVHEDLRESVGDESVGDESVGDESTDGESTDGESAVDVSTDGASAGDDSTGDAADGEKADGEKADGERAGDVSTGDAADSEKADDAAGLALRPSLEAVLMIADTPLDHMTLAQAVGRPPQEVADALHDLAADYTEQGRGFDLREVAGGWRFYTRDEFAPVVERFVVDGQQARLTQAALETLAVVAYRQPVSRARVSAIRAVNVDGVMRTLVTRGLVEEAGSDPETGAVLYRTTSYFLERIGLTSLEALPDIAPLLPEMEDVEDDLDPRPGAEPAAPTTPTPTTTPTGDDSTSP